MARPQPRCVLRVRAPPVWRLESCTTPLPCSALSMLSVARRRSASLPSEKEAAALVVPARSCAGPVTRALLAVSGRKSRKCVIANHPAMIATSRLATTLAHSQTTKIRSWPALTNGRAAFRLFHPPNVFPHLGDSRTTPPLHHNHWTGLAASPASTDPSAQVQAEAAP